MIASRRFASAMLVAVSIAISAAVALATDTERVVNIAMDTATSMAEAKRRLAIMGHPVKETRG
jgi:hypothetical protein